MRKTLLLVICTYELYIHKKSEYTLRAAFRPRRASLRQSEKKFTYLVQTTIEGPAVGLKDQLIQD